jgi:MscS family membrane protein
MKQKLELIVRIYVFALVALLFWAVWTEAQTNTVPATNAASRRAAAGAAGSSRGNSIVNKDQLTFGLDQIEVLNHQWPSGIPLWQYFASLIYIFLALCVSKLLDSLTRVWLKKWAERTKTKFDDLLIGLLSGPVKIVVFVIFLKIGLEVFDWGSVVNNILDKGLKIIVAGTITYAVLKLIDLSMGYWKERAAVETDRTFDEQLFPIIRKTLKVFVTVVAVLVTSQNLGFNITAAIAGLSVGGLALGLAAQDTVAHLFGAVAIFIDKPFRIGDRIQLDSVDGMVETIGLRSTRLRSLDGHLITIPNKTMGNATITNITRRPNIKTVMDIGITYDTPTVKVKRALQILKEVYKDHPQTHDCLISFNKFADSALNIQVVHWWNSTDHKEYLVGLQGMNLTVKERFDLEGIGFAFPTRTLYVKQDSEWRLTEGARQSVVSGP